MANPWRIAAMGWGITVVGWLLSPIISLLLNKFFSNLFDASGKIRELEIQTIPKLEQILREIEEERMHRKAKKERSAVQKLDKLARIVKPALYEAEDILDLIDYHRIEKDVIGDGEPHGGNWQQHLYDAVCACIAHCKRSLYSMGQFIQATTLHRSAGSLPISRAPSVSSFEFSSCSIVIWSAKWIEVARSYRDWSYDRVGVTSRQEDDLPVDSILPTIARWNLRKRIEKLENIVMDVEKSPLLINKSSGALNDVNINRKSITSSSTRKVFGRDEERDIIRTMLREGPAEYAPSSSSSKCYSVICIHGIPGSGKTTLAQYVCDYEKEDKDRYFDTIMLVYVSKTYRLEDIFHNMLEEITQDRHSKISDCKGLEAKLVEQLRGKRFLLALDDLWVNDENHEKLLSPLNVGKAGSRILVTAQSKEAALGSNRLIAISDLDDEQYFSMFMHYALGSTISDDQEREFIPIGRKIAERLNRSPIAAVTVAGQLWRNRDIGFWQTTANLDVLNKTKGALWWSYNQLIVDVRRCFLYCSIFPRRYELERDNLVRMWIAQGFVKNNDASKEDVQDVGQEYFHDLHSCSFLQLKRKSTSDIDSGEYFTVHDMFHELAVTIAGSDCVRIEKGIVSHLPKYVRHLCIESYNEIVFPERILELTNLRTLIMCYSVESMSENDFENVLMRLRKLRVVHLDLRDLSTVPACIGELKHLRYLGISRPLNDNRITLPDEFAKLYHLHELWIPPRSNLHFSSPAKMGNLVNLRCMHTWNGLDIPDIGRLKLLQNLFRFVVKKEPEGYEVHQLEHMNNLRGRLLIDGLENVSRENDATRAKLSDKKHVTDLTLTWGRGRDESSEFRRGSSPELEAHVLQELRPPSSITGLCIRDYSGLTYPSWLTGGLVRQREFPALRTLMFWNCNNGSNIPPTIGEHLGLLRELSISDCRWKFLPANLEFLTKLESLSVQNCPNISSLPTLPQSLRSLEFHACNVFFIASCRSREHPNGQKIRDIRMAPYRFASGQFSISFYKLD